MPNCKLLLPPVHLADRILSDEGAIAYLDDQTADVLAALGVVEILSEGLPDGKPKPVEAPVMPRTGQQIEEAIAPAEPWIVTVLNVSTEAELVALPHIGKTIAQKLIKARPLTLEKAEAIAKLSEIQWAEIKTAVRE